MFMSQVVVQTSFDEWGESLSCREIARRMEKKLIAHDVGLCMDVLVCVCAGCSGGCAQGSCMPLITESV